MVPLSVPVFRLLHFLLAPPVMYGSFAGTLPKPIMLPVPQQWRAPSSVTAHAWCVPTATDVAWSRGEYWPVLKSNVWTATACEQKARGAPEASLHESGIAAGLTAMIPNTLFCPTVPTFC